MELPLRARRLRLSLILPLLLIILLAVVLIRTGWVCDDAYITLRTVDNFVQGLGLRWNPAERVQSYTHPLWLFLLAAIYYFTREPYFTSLILGMLLSLVTAVIVAFRVGRSARAVVPALLIMILSKAFTDYSTSGLENPLSHLLLVILMLVYLRDSIDRRRLFQVSLVFALIALNRLDLVLIAGPFLLAAWKETGWAKGWRMVLVGLLPIILWEIFSLVYYGLPFPNTAYAKLETGLSQGELVRQSGWYFWESLKIDPLTLTGILAGLVLAFSRRSKGDIPVAIGILLYLVYIVKIGGDFMGGRFFVAPLLMAVLLIARIDFTPPKARRLAPLLALLVIVVGLSSPENPLFSGASYGVALNADQIYQVNGGVADERGYYYRYSGLLNYRRGTIWPRGRSAGTGRAFRNSHRKAAFVANVGYMGYFAGPDVYLYDPLALSDPLLSHLPVVRYRWRIGHGFRLSPAGHFKSVTVDSNAIADSSLHKFYDVIRTLTRASLLDLERLRAIVRFNLGGYGHLLREYLNRPPRRINVTSQSRSGGYGPSPSQSFAKLTRAGAMFVPSTKLDIREVSMRLERRSDYEILAFNDDSVIAADTVTPTDRSGTKSPWAFAIAAGTTSVGCDSLLVRPLYGRGDYWVADVTFLP